MKITFEAKNEGLRYEDETGAYRFNLSLNRRIWHVELPPSKEPELKIYHLSKEEESRIFPAIEHYLSRIWWFGIWPQKYTVKFVSDKDA